MPEVHFSGGDSQCRPLKGITPTLPPPSRASGSPIRSYFGKHPCGETKATCLICFLVLFQSLVDWPRLFSEL